MKKSVRNIYPGGNTPRGFFSYYNYILPQRSAKKLYCIKGGPGTGKSTMMKEIGMYFSGKGEGVDLFWCSSDPESLDGVLLKERNVAVVDGTSPHVVDPKNPGAVDEILDLSDFWDERKLRNHREEIIRCNEKTGECFEFAYGYLKCAGMYYEFMADILEKMTNPGMLQDCERQLEMIFGGVSAVRRGESRVMHEMAMGSIPLPGFRKKFFAGAVTCEGIKSSLESLVKNTGKVIILKVPAGFRTERLLTPLSARLVNAGFDVEEYYCPMDPDNKLEHIISPDADIAVISCNEYHGADLLQSGRKIVEVNLEQIYKSNHTYRSIFENLREESRKTIVKAVEQLAAAKKYHDELESYYIQAMDFEKIGMCTKKIIEEIEAGNN